VSSASVRGDLSQEKLLLACRAIIEQDSFGVARLRVGNSCFSDCQEFPAARSAADMLDISSHGLLLS